MVREFSDRTLRCLRSAGWSVERRLDVGAQLEELRADGFSVSAAVEDFLARFGNLRLTYPHAKDPTVVDYAHFDAVRSAKAVFPARLKDWESRTGERLTPIGESDREYMILLMGPSGAVYSAMDDLIYRLAPTGEEAISSLCEGREPEGTVT